jgi:C-terminal processing protease CtpA/Prc
VIRVYYIYSYSFSGNKGQKEKTNRLLRELIKSKPKHVILDLTDNPGGRLNLASHLLSYFLNTSHAPASTVRMRSRKADRIAGFNYHSEKDRKSHKKSIRPFRSARKKRGQYTLGFRKGAFGNPDYKGNLTVLISPRTHSAATVVASVLKRKRQAKLIGYTNAGSTRTSCFAANGYYQLPNTKITVLIPDTCYDRRKNSRQNDAKLQPYIIIDPLGGDSSGLNSRILQAALEEIEKTDQ